MGVAGHAAESQAEGRESKDPGTLAGWGAAAPEEEGLVPGTTQSFEGSCCLA